MCQGQDFFLFFFFLILLREQLSESKHGGLQSLVCLAHPSDAFNLLVIIIEVIWRKKKNENLLPSSAQIPCFDILLLLMIYSIYY